MKWNLKKNGWVYGIGFLAALCLGSACDREKDELLLPEEDGGSVLLLARAGAASDVYINLSNIDWTKSNVFEARCQEVKIAEICKEYLRQDSVADCQAVVVYLMDATGKQVDYQQGYVTQVIDLQTERPDIYRIHNGRVAFTRTGGKTSCVYTPGKEAPKTIVCIGQATRSLATFEEADLVPLLCYDADRNAYATVKIGLQYWQRENLKTTHYLNNDTINKGIWDDGEGGKFYNFAAIDQKLFIKDYRLPADSDWEQLIDYVGDVPGKKMQNLWPSILKGTNVTGFCAKPAGYCDVNGKVIEKGTLAYWWASSYSCWYTRIVKLERQPLSEITYGLSVRCMRDAL